MIELRAFEPSGCVLTLSVEEATRHIIALGSTGSGKTTALINPVLRQIVAFGADSAHGKLGVLVLDAKGDDSIEKLLEYAREAGREKDVVVLGPRGRGNSFYDFFAGFQRLDQVDEFARRLLGGSRDMGPWNAYWTETRAGIANAALVLLLAGGERFDFDAAVQFLRAFFYESESDLVRARVGFVEQLLKTGRLSPTTRRRLDLAVREAQN